jgi:peptidoglycan hydrolase-like protein with peptidoglycan-binding domain
MPISQSVGRGGGNVKKDVRFVQALLSFWRQENGRTVIAVDGLVGPITIAAIEDFQRAKTGIVDGRVDPRGPSLKALEDEFASYTRMLKALSVLSLVLSYDPELEAPALNDRELAAMLRSVSPSNVG